MQIYSIFCHGKGSKSSKNRAKIVPQTDQGAEKAILQKMLPLPCENTFLELLGGLRIDKKTSKSRLRNPSYEFVYV